MKKVNSTFKHLLDNVCRVVMRFNDRLRNPKAGYGRWGTAYFPISLFHWCSFTRERLIHYRHNIVHLLLKNNNIHMRGHDKTTTVLSSKLGVHLFILAN